MTFLRNLVRDLVDKKLWPVALLLVAALVAIPVVLGSSSGDSAAPAPQPVAGDATAPGPGSVAQVAVAELDTTAKNRAGKVRNPFKGPKIPKETDLKPDAVKAPEQKTTSPAPSSTPTTPTPAPAPPATSAPKTVKKPASKPQADAEPNVDESWVATMRFGIGGESRKLKAYGRLAPLPSSENPIIAFLGVLEDHKSALFLVSSDADTNGDGKCTPSKTECEILRMRADDTQFFDVTLEDGRVVQYQLDLERVRKRKSAAAKAKTAKADSKAKASAAAVP